MNGDVGQTAAGLLAWLRSLGADISAEGGRLRVLASPGTLTAEARAAITLHKPALLDLLAAEPAAGRDDGGLVPIARGGRLPVSAFQQRMWLLEQLRRPDEPSFNMVTLWDMPADARGRDPALLQRAIGDVVRRHDILRSAIRSEAAEPFMVLLPADAVRIELRDLRDLPAERQRAAIEADTMAAVTAPFDLTSEPPLRWRIFVTGDGALTVQVCADHIAVDEWSFVLLRRELDAALAACAAGETLPKPVLQYADYAAWERRRAQSPAAAADLDWWRQTLADLPQGCTFPPDRPGRIAASAGYRFTWDRGFTDALRELGRSRRATLFMVLLAGLAAVLRAHTGRSDIAVGSSLGVRERPELEAMIGAFVNVVVLRLDLQDDPGFADLLTRARDAVLDAHEHRHVSFETLVARLKPERSRDVTPWFQVSVVMHNASGEDPSPIYSGGAALDMTWFTRETEDGLVMTLEYRSDRYDASTIARLARHLRIVLGEAVRDPSRPVGAISLLTQEERALILRDFNATAAALDPAPVTVQFERQVRLTPQAVALRAGGVTLGYEELNRRANRLARHLRRNGAGPGVLVGVCMERSAGLLACLLAVLKTGAAYVPLDPEFPAARLDFMVGHSGVALLVVEGAAPAWAQSGAARMIDLAEDATAIVACDGEDLGIVPDGLDPAYVIYTSGSTGRPNGVVVPHAALANLLGAMKRTPGLSAGDVLAAVTTISFDIAGLELYLPLVTGACVVLVPAATARDGAALAALLAETGATVMQATPATWRLLIEAGWRGGAGITAWCGGERLADDLAAALLERVAALWNLYGPTETTIWSSAGRIEPGASPIVIGRPIANTHIVIVDAAGQPVPVGVAGEIWIGGAGVATGYWRNPALTAAKFLDDPFVEGGGRIYRTGDLGRWLPDGRIVHMGRVDEQIKLRGQRIEPGEIEAVLLAHPSVRQALVVARGETAERQRLVAYVVYCQGQDLTSSEMRAHLRGFLPDYMVPSAFVAIDALPRTPNGKVDRRALPDPFRESAAAAATYIPPAPGAEQLVAKIWADILQIERVGAGDNFFDLGGYSLLSLRVAAAIHAQTGWRLPPYTLFVQTLGQIAAALQAHQAELRAAE
jgi:amino acid adenylation domain-containing protein